MLCHILNTTFRWFHEEVNHLLGNQSAFIEYLSWENTAISWVITWDLMIYNTHHKERRNDSAKYLVARWYLPPYLEVSDVQYIKIFVSSLCSIYSKGLHMTLLKLSVYIYLWSLFTVRNVTFSCQLSISCVITSWEGKSLPGIRWPDSCLGPWPHPCKLPRYSEPQLHPRNHMGMTVTFSLLKEKWNIRHSLPIESPPHKKCSSVC